jgi:ribosomal protein S18 acetylase RimI-like enzyme
MTPEEVRTREATPADLRQCAGLIAASESDDVEEWLQRFTDVLHDPDRRFLVAVIDDAVVGFGHLRYVRHDARSNSSVPSGWYLSGVTVAASHRRRGIGTQLTRERLRLLQGIADCVYYAAEDDNEATLAMHRRLGFVLVGKVSIPASSQPMQLHRLDLGST